MPRPQLKISVPKPCSENWNAMTPQAKGRFCASCATTVVDFSQFTDKQLLDYFANRSGKTCGRFSVSQLNRPVYAETLPKQNLFPRALAAAALFLGISSQTQAQNNYNHPTPAGQVIEKKASEEETPAKTVGKTPEKGNGDSLVISGRVIDSETKEPIPFGNVLIKDTKIYAQTDFDGNFRIVLPDTFQLEEFALITSNVGYNTKILTGINRKVLLGGEQAIVIKVNQSHSVDLEIVGMAYPMTPKDYLRSFWWKTKNLFRKND